MVAARLSERESVGRRGAGPIEQVLLDRVARDHARWFSGIVSELTEAQVRQAFETAGATPEEVNGFAAVIMRRIAALKEAEK